MNQICFRLSLGLASVLLYSTFVFAGPLDDHYLQQFGEAKSAQLQKAILSTSTDVHESARCGMPLKHALKRDWKSLELATQSVLAKQLAYPVLTSALTYTSSAGHFKVHYASRGTDAPPPTDLNNNGVPDWVETVAATFETVYGNYSSMGYNPAPTAGGAPYDVYLHDLASQSLYGVTTSDQTASSTGYPNAYTSWIEIDNNFTNSIYKTSTPLESLQITAAHEYHHAIQFGYNYYFEKWYGEATSTWMEDEMYDSVNQLYNYIPSWFTQSTLSLDTSASTTTGGGYGRWIFNRYLAEKHGTVMIRGVWEKLATIASPSASDIPMSPVLDGLLSSSYGSSLGNDFLDLAKRVYKRDWISHPGEIGLIPTYTPEFTYRAYQLSATAVTLPHYSFAYYKFLPSTSSPDSLNITVTGTSGIRATAFVKNSAGAISEYPFSTVNGTSVIIPGFNSSNEAVLLIANTSSLDGHNASFSTDGSSAAVTEPLAPAPTPTTTSGGSSGGCFIATAAYGSYLHPHVQLLRQFRDDYLLTNAPGRAFVAFYYRCSPPLADFIARHTLLRGLTRLLLTPLVVAVAHPLISAVSLLILFGTILAARLRRIRIIRSNARQYIY